MGTNAGITRRSCQNSRSALPLLTPYRGPLVSGVEYYGYPEDAEDYFKFIVATSGQVTIQLKNYIDPDGWLMLYDSQYNEKAKACSVQDFRIQMTVEPDTYYIRIRTENVSETPYTLLVTFPPPFPGTPVLNVITAPGVNLTYLIDWEPASLAETYTLEQATLSDFSDAKNVYNGADTSYTAASEGIARYYYRVKAHNQFGDGNWSDVVQSVEVFWEQEPNYNAPAEANGPLASNVLYYGRFPQGDDQIDYFYFSLSTEHVIEIWLTNIPTPFNEHDYDLFLYDSKFDCIALSNQTGTDSESITIDISPGTYYIQVMNYEMTGSPQPYHLRVVYD